VYENRCDGLTRRNVLEVGSLAFLGLGLPQWCQAKETAAGPDASCIFIWLDGGPSHLDTFDLKPDAPSEVRGTFKAIPTAVNGVQICEHFPMIARQMDKVSLLRTLTSEIAEHDQAGHYLNTGYKPSPSQSYPSYGSVISRLKGNGAALPPYVAVPAPRPYQGSGYMPSAYNPFTVVGDPSRKDFKVRDLDFPLGFTEDRLQTRRTMLEKLDSFDRA
jgi:hypothetical protein